MQPQYYQHCNTSVFNTTSGSLGPPLLSIQVLVQSLKTDLQAWHVGWKGVVWKHPSCDFGTHPWAGMTASVAPCCSQKSPGSWCGGSCFIFSTCYFFFLLPPLHWVQPHWPHSFFWFCQGFFSLSGFCTCCLLCWKYSSPSSDWFPSFC